MTDLDNRIADLEAKLKARRGKSAYRDNVPAIEAELERLKGVRGMIEEAKVP